METERDIYTSIDVPRGKLNMREITSDKSLGNQDEEPSKSKITLMSISNFILDLSDNKQHIRMASLKGLKMIFQKSYLNLDPNWIQFKWLFQYCHNTLNMGSQNEKSLCLQVLCLLVIQSEKLAEIISTEYSNKIHAIITDHFNDDNLIRNAIGLLGSLQLFSGVENQESSIKNIGDIFELLQKLALDYSSYIPLENGKLSMFITAFDCWSIVLSLLSTDDVLWSSITFFEIALNLLQFPNGEIRRSCGRCLALIYETVLNKTKDTYEFDDQGVVLEEITKLAKSSTKYDSKEERKADRKIFREILKSIETDNEYDQILEIWMDSKRKAAIKIDSWTKAFYYNFLCEVLEDGIMVHLRKNEKVQDWFGFEVGLTEENIVQSVENKVIERQQKKLFKEKRTKFRNCHKTQRTVTIDADDC